MAPFPNLKLSFKTENQDNQSQPGTPNQVATCIKLASRAVVYLPLLFVIAVVIATSLACALPAPESGGDQTPRPELVFPTRETVEIIVSAVPVENTPSAPGDPAGIIAYVCQIFKLQAKDQICIINADGSGQRRLTREDNARHFYPSVAPDGRKVIFSSDMDGQFRLYESTLDGVITPVGNVVGFAPEISPDGSRIAYVNNDGSHDMVWICNRDGSNPTLLYKNGWDPTWSPDGKQILFATDIDNFPQLAVINLDGTGFTQISHLDDFRGRSDWSPQGKIVTYAGKPWQRELYLMNSDGSDVHQLSPAGGNSQGPSFSPDGQWVAFTAYFDAIGNNNACEIYLLKVDGTGLKRLTDNGYCDWQPRWGP